MVKADGHVRIRHESKENGQIRVRHESKEKGKGISYIEVDNRDREKLMTLDNLDFSLYGLADSCIHTDKCLISCPHEKHSGENTPPSENCSCGQRSPESGSLISGENSDVSNTNSSSRNSKISTCDTCSKLLNRENSQSPSHSSGGACNVVDDDPSARLCNCDHNLDNPTENGDIPDGVHPKSISDPLLKKGYHYEFALQGPGEAGTKQNKKPVTVSKLDNYVQCCEYASTNKEVEILTCQESDMEKGTSTSKKTCCYHVFVLLILLCANLLNYMDRYTIAGVLPDIKKFYSQDGDPISDSQAGLLQTSFIVFYMLFSPLFGYLGDRYNRTILMSVGILAWSIVTLAGSFIPADRFWLFVFMRGLVGIGEASYSTIAPTIIADLFTKDNRTKALALFYFAIPVGSGLGYIVGSVIAKAAGAWQWSLRFTPGLGLLCAVLIFFLVKEPPRGESEGGVAHKPTSGARGYLDDLLYLVKNKSFVLSTAGFTCVAFLAGALSFWAPTYMEYAIEAMNHDESISTVSLKFGIITCVAGLLGVLIGSESARRLRHKYKKADPIVCAVGLIGCAPFFFAGTLLAQYNTTATWIAIFIGETLLCLNWSIVTDILLYIVIPTRRSTAEAFQILISHALGDAGSPYLVGLVSDAIKGDDTTVHRNFISLQYALYMMAFVAVLGGGLFLATAHYIVKDKERADKIIRGEALPDAEESEQSLCEKPIYTGKELAPVIA